MRLARIVIESVLDRERDYARSMGDPVDTDLASMTAGEREAFYDGKAAGITLALKLLRQT